ncbi:AAA family ATPase [Oscillatoriales cyanobacterium LEGE 11467]|uniref:histidine kinase n=1 Tax=Zarconia navalis LEGE 11467 TaxID=1828826 RepID=A0A928Z8E6_9CYAN|nr:ATP-binding sensor histidine kinase [Zarconia navalis]MBE9039776.1 AAA family ATPase [Zarconia navalis LEGE 11467]
MTTLPGYHLGENLYQGTRTQVYRGTRITDEQPVVIKFLRNEYPSFSELVQFRNQYTIAKNLDLPGIVNPLALKTHGNGYALVMPDKGYISLSEWKQGEWAIVDFLTIAVQLADILHGLDRNRVIHKDIKPANILIHPETQQVKLIDFSISSLLPKETLQISNPNVLEGTLAYISPEQTGRMNRGIDYRTDFYSLGVTFYELLMGELPFQSDDALELVHCHIAKSPMELGNGEPFDRLKAAQGTENGEEIPQVISNLVVKLMAKNAEDRYQSALGLKHDLERCLFQWKETGCIEPFELGERDLCDRFIIPEKLYGREAEVKTLLTAFDRVANGNTEMILVAGFSGIGKTAVVSEIHKPIVRQQGYFIQGKFDQFNRNIPFSAFVEAFRNLMGQLLCESDAQLQQWKTKIQAALGESAQVTIEVIPELESIIGVQPPVPELSGSAAQNRFNLLFGKFVEVFTTRDHPLVIFLDDLQWADSASLNLLKLLMEKIDTGYLLILGAYRDNEVDPAHPLMLTLDEIVKKEAIVNTITLAPLSQSGLNHLIADVLTCPLELAVSLTKLVYQKTKGNPFFATQFLKGLYEDGEITFDLEAGYWQCDIARIRQLSLTDDVVEFMASRLHRLPQETQEILKLAACVGNTFDLSTLAIVSEYSQEKVATALWKALQEGLVLPANQTYKFFQGSKTNRFTVSDPISVNYKFLHDRIQQAAYSLIPQTQKRATHYRLGWLLFENIGKEEQNERIFEIVNNLNYGIELIDDRDEEIEIAGLNLKTARKAKKSVAYSAATAYVKTGIALVGEDGWKTDYRLTFNLYKEGSEIKFLNGDVEQSEHLAFQTLKRANSAIDKAEIYNILIVQHTVTSKFKQAVDEGRIALKLLGIEWDEDNLDKELDREFEAAKKRLGDRDISSLIDLPEMEIPEKRSAVQVMHTLLPLTYSFNQSLWRVLIVKIVNLSLQHGHIPECCFGYSFYGVLIGCIFKDYEAGYEFGILSLNLSQKFKDLAQESKACNILAAFLLQWRQHISHCEAINNQGYSAGLESGQLQFIGYIAYNRILSLFHSGKNLNELLAEFPIYLPLLEDIKHYYAYDITAGCQLATQILTSPTSTSAIARQQDIEEAQHLEVCRDRNSFPGTCAYQIFKAQISYLFDRPEDAREYLSSAQEIIEFLAGHFTLAEHAYYQALTCLKLYPNASTQEKVEMLKQVEEDREQLQVWTDNCPDNFQHKLHLVEAERSRVLGEKLKAIELYDLAISGAKENQFVQDEALANELAAKFYLDWGFDPSRASGHRSAGPNGKEKIARAYILEAYYCYARWGAKAKTDHLETSHPQLLAPILQQPLSPQSLNATTTIPSRSTIGTSASTNGSFLDISAAIKASQALSGEIELEALLSQLMKIVLANAGADKGTFILKNARTWEIVAQCVREHCQLSPTPLEKAKTLPVNIVRMVQRTQKTVILNQVENDTRFAGDSYLIQQQPKSLFCTPILNQGRSIGILYLENNLSAEAFTSERVEVLNLLCSQAAISIENARLYEQSQAANNMLQKSLDELQNAQLQLVQSEKMSALGNLVAGVAHEINNPVGFIGGNLQPARDYVGDLLGLIDLYQQENPNPSEVIEEEIEAIDLDFLRSDLPKLIDSMKLGVDRIGHISTSLRTFSRTDKEHKVPFNLHDGIDSTLLILKHRLKANEQRPAIEIVKEYGDIPEVQCFPGQLNQVFMNLIANAIDALEEGNGERSFEEIAAEPNQIKISTEVTSKNAIVRIRDNGAGMPENVKQRIFEQGFTTKGVGKGTGLGMAIARQIVEENHGGSIEVDSQFGQGTIFKIQVPIGQDTSKLNR